MDAFKALAIGWSIVWSACLLGLAGIKLKGVPYLFLAMGSKTIGRQPLYYVPLYAGIIWIVGILALYQLVWRATEMSQRWQKKKPPKLRD